MAHATRTSAGFALSCRGPGSTRGAQEVGSTHSSLGAPRASRPVLGCASRTRAKYAPPLADPAHACLFQRIQSSPRALASGSPASPAFAQRLALRFWYGRRYLGAPALSSLGSLSCTHPSQPGKGGPTFLRGPLLRCWSFAHAFLPSPLHAYRRQSPRMPPRCTRPKRRTAQPRRHLSPPSSCSAVGHDTQGRFHGGADRRFRSGETLSLACFPPVPVVSPALPPTCYFWSTCVHRGGTRRHFPRPAFFKRSRRTTVDTKKLTPTSSKCPPQAHAMWDRRWQPPWGPRLRPRPRRGPSFDMCTLGPRRRRKAS